MAAVTPRVTFGIIARERIPELDRLIVHMLSLSVEGGSEVVVVVECREATALTETAEGASVRWIEVPARQGLGYNRNRVLAAARGEILVWADDDCMPKPGWLEGLLGALDDPTVDAAAGALEIPEAGFLGDSISALGFPAGGSAGYATMFVVHDDGTTENLPSGNSAVRIALLREIGGYNESMTLGGEDTELSHRLVESGKRIVYVPDAVLMHPARKSLAEFARWSFRRGRAKRQFALGVPVAGYVTQRVDSYFRILRSHITDPKIIVIAPLLAANLLLQGLGFVAEMISPTHAAPLPPKP